MIEVLYVTIHRPAAPLAVSVAMEEPSMNAVPLLNAILIYFFTLVLVTIAASPYTIVDHERPTHTKGIV